MDRQATSKSRILEDCDFRTTAMYQRWNLFSMSLMTKLTLTLTPTDPLSQLNLTLTDPHDA